MAEQARGDHPAPTSRPAGATPGPGWAAALPWAVGVAAGVAAVGSALGPGYLLRLDMVAVPSPPLNAGLLGLGPELPRAVPSDLVLALASRLAPGGWALKLIIVATFALAVAGMARLVPTANPVAANPVSAHPVAATAAGVLYAWNPWTAERLAIGHWPQLIGYAALPWVALATRHLIHTGRYEPLVVALILPAIGGISACVLAGTLIFCLLATARAGRTAWLTALAGVVLVSLPWLLPSLLRRTSAYVDPAGVDAFALRPDGRFGPVGTALQLGGMWNRLAVPAGRGQLLVQVAALALTGFALWGLRRALGAGGPLQTAPGRPVQAAAGGPLQTAAGEPGRNGTVGLAVAGAVGLGLALLPTVGVGAAAMRGLVSVVPAVAAFRDSDRWLALLALPVAVGFGVAVDRIARRGTAAAVLGVLAPVALLPGLAGQLHNAHYPAGWTAARAVIDGDPAPGAVLALPWNTFRVYGWSGDRLPVITPATKMFGRPVRWNDAVIVSGTEIAAEAPDVPALTAIVDAGTDDRQLEQHGIRYVLVESGQRPAPDLSRLDAEVVLRDADLTLYRLNGPASPAPDPVHAAKAIEAADLLVIGLISWCALWLLAGKLRGRRR